MNTDHSCVNIIYIINKHPKRVEQGKWLSIMLTILYFVKLFFIIKK